MVLKNAFILSAGLGTRMGEIGQKIPKPLWPIFESNMIEVHIKRLRAIGVENIYINTHHFAEQFNEWLKAKKLSNVKLLHEKEILGSGGAIHNLKKKTGLCEQVLCINADIYYLLNESHYQNALQAMREQQAAVLLFSVPVEKEDSYNRLEVKDQKLKKIVPPSLSAPTMTYSGVGIVDLAKLDYIAGNSSFFKTVANFEYRKVLVHAPKQVEYWDFGTAARYIDSHFKLLEGVSDFKQELINFHVMNEQKDYRTLGETLDISHGHNYRVKCPEDSREILI